MTELYNRPGLSELRYRAGTFGSFRAAMLKELALRPDLNLTAAGDGNDYGTALVDLWAYLGDILSFYQERYVQEAFLRTAVHRDSLQRLGAMLAYRPRPGAAAQTWVAFQVEADAPVELPAGLRLQSAPVPGEQPRKYETVEPVKALQALNRIPVRPLPAGGSAHNPYAKESTGGFIRPGFDTGKLKPGDRLLLTTSAKFSAVEKRLTALTRHDGLTRLTFDPPMQDTWVYRTTKLFTLRRQWRLFGAHAPRTYIPVGSEDPVTTVFLRENATHIDLEGPVEGVQDNTRVLIVYEHPGSPEIPANTWCTHLATITSAVPISSAVGAADAEPFMTGPATRIFIDPGLTLNIHQATVYELGEEVPLWCAAYPGQIPAGAVSVFVPPGADLPLEVGRTVLLGDENGPPELVTVQGVRIAEAPGGVACQEIQFSPPLSRALQTDSAVLYGNVALATHGESVKGEVLGSGDPAIAGQQFTLKKAPVTYLQGRSSAELTSTLSVWVDGVRWQEVESFLEQPPEARVYTTTVDEHGAVTVHFGDGVHGARLPRGTGNVVASYRHGSGAAGAVRAGSLNTLLDRPLGLKAVHNPGDAFGGRDAATPEDLRRAIPSAVATFGRAVSLRDYEELALSFAGVAKARAERVRGGLQQAVHLTVAGPDGSPVDRQALRLYLDGRRDPNIPLLLDNHLSVPVYTRVRIQVRPGHAADQVEAAVRTALAGYFAFGARSFGEPVYRSDLYRVVQAVEGVEALRVEELGFADGLRRTEAAADELPIRTARYEAGSSGRILPAELACVRYPDTEIDVVRGDAL